MNKMIRGKCLRQEEANEKHRTTKGSINIKTIPDLAKKVIETSHEISSKLVRIK